MYEYKAKYDAWFKVIIAIPIAGMVIGAIISLNFEREAALVLFGAGIFLAFLFWLIMPRKFRITEDKLKIVIGASLAFNITYRNIKAVRMPGILTCGVNFATSTRTLVEIVRKRGVNISISPENRETFLQNIDKAILEWRRYYDRHDKSY